MEASHGRHEAGVHAGRGQSAGADASGGGEHDKPESGREAAILARPGPANRGANVSPATDLIDVNRPVDVLERFLPMSQGEAELPKIASHVGRDADAAGPASG